jgi:hypothetical protein
LRVAVNEAVASAAVLPAVTLNVAEFTPDGMRTEFGIPTELLLLANAMLNPLDGAALVKVTVQLLVPPGPMTAGPQTRLDKLVPAGGLIAKTIERVTPAELADIVEDWLAVTALVPTVNTPLDRPAGMVN